MCKSKFLQMCLFHNILISLHCIATLIPRIFCIATQIPDPDFKKIVALVQERALPFVTTV